MLFKHQIFKSSPFHIELMTFEIVERFQTIVAPVSYTHLDVYKRQERVRVVSYF